MQVVRGRNHDSLAVAVFMEERPVRLVLVDLSPRVGAPQRTLWELASRLPRERYEVRLWLSADDAVDGLAEAFEARGFGVDRLSAPAERWSWKAPLHLWLQVRRARPGIVHVHAADAPGGLRVARAVMAEGIPVAITLHDAASIGSDPEARKVYARADAVLAAHRTLAESINAWGRCERVRWIPPAIGLPDVEAEAPAARAWRDRLGARPLRPLWVCPLRLDPGRGHDVLLDALTALRHRGLDFAAALVGDGPRRPELERAVGARGLDAHVRFVDELDDTGPLLTAADAVVFPALDGPLPAALLEAMARARPVVASGLAPVAEVIEDGVHGRLLPPGDTAALAETLEGFHRRPDAALRVGRAAAERTRAAFTWKRVVEAHEDVYDEVLGFASFAPPARSRLAH